jgi:hypothetical protein
MEYQPHIFGMSFFVGWEMIICIHANSQEVLAFLRKIHGPWCMHIALNLDSTSKYLIANLNKFQADTKKICATSIC